MAAALTVLGLPPQSPLLGATAAGVATLKTSLCTLPPLHGHTAPRTPGGGQAPLQPPSDAHLLHAPPPPAPRGRGEGGGSATGGSGLEDVSRGGCREGAALPTPPQCPVCAEGGSLFRRMAAWVPSIKQGSSRLRCSVSGASLGEDNPPYAVLAEEGGPQHAVLVGQHTLTAQVRSRHRRVYL